MQAMGEGQELDVARRRRVLVTTVILALVAVGFYASIFFAVSARH